MDEDDETDDVSVEANSSRPRCCCCDGCRRASRCGGSVGTRVTRAGEAPGPKLRASKLDVERPMRWGRKLVLALAAGTCLLGR